MQTNDYLAAIRTGIKNFVNENTQANLHADAAQFMLFDYIRTEMVKVDNQVSWEEDDPDEWTEFNVNYLTALKGVH